MNPVTSKFATVPTRALPREPDLIQRASDLVSTRSFELLTKTKDPSKLQGAMRVAYGPLDAPPVLSRPVVMVPGFTMEAASFDRMANQLASHPANGPVAVYVASEGQFRKGSPQGPVLSEAELKGAKIFEVQYADPFSGPSVKAVQLTKALAQVQRATRAKDLDVVTHSEGGTDFRLYLDSRADGPSIHRAVMVGPASHGTMVGNIGAVVGHVKGANVAAGELAVGSPLNQQLEKGWAKQRAQVPGGVTLLRVTGAPTLAPGDGPLGVKIANGDGFMPANAVPLPGAANVSLHGPHHTPLAHLWEIQYSGVINETLKALGA